MKINRDLIRITLYLSFGLCLLTACSQPTYTPDIPFVQKKTNGGLENAYYTSYAFDSCGDGASGQRYRAALQDKANACDLPPLIKAAFARSTARMDEIMPQKVLAWLKQYGAHPEKSGDYLCSGILTQRDTVLSSVQQAPCDIMPAIAGPAQISVLPPPKSPPLPSSKLP